MARAARFAWFVLAYNVGVILWGAYVRATGSGAGCGAHWPLCNGEVLPRSAGAATLIEFSHRASSGVALVLVAALVWWVFRATRPGEPARGAAIASGVLIVTEAGVGAGLVLFRLVADNATMARAMFVAVHLVNTFLLLAALAATAWWLTVRRPVVWRRDALRASVAGCAALVIAGASGAVAALGDTLFPAASLGEALAADLSLTSHLLIRLRVLHPVLAVLAAAAVALCAGRLARTGTPVRARAALVVMAIAAFQVALGFVNVVLLAPVWMQIVHLLVADALWLAFVLLGADVLTAQTSEQQKAQAA